MKEGLILSLRRATVAGAPPSSLLLAIANVFALAVGTFPALGGGGRYAAVASQ